jgi:hypothetical protein
MSDIRELYLYSDDTGTANAYELTYPLTPTWGAPQTVAGMPLAPLVAGNRVVFKAANANTGASTLEVNLRGPLAIKKNGTADLASGDIVAGQMVSLIFDGTYWQMVAGAVGPAGVSGGGTVSVGTRAALPSTVPSAGTMYKCTDSAIEYVSDGTNWKTFFYGLPIEDASLNASVVTKSTNTLSATFIDKTTLGGILFGGTCTGTDHLMMQVVPVTPSSTLVVRVNLLTVSNGAGWVIWNDNTGKAVWIRMIGNTLAYARYQNTTGFVTNGSLLTSGTFVNPFPAGSNPQAIAGCLGYMAFVFDGTSWFVRRYVDPGCTLQASATNTFTETLATWIGTNYTHVGFGAGVNSTSGASSLCWGIDLKIVHT